MVPLMTYSSPSLHRVGLDGGAGLVVQEVRIGTGVGLGARQAEQERVVLHELGQPLVALLGVELAHQTRRLGVAAPDDGGEALVGRAQLFEDEGQSRVVGTLAAALLGDGGGAQAQLRGLLEQVPGNALLRVALRSYFMATGLTSFWAKSRTMSRIISCSSVSLKSMRSSCRVVTVGFAE